MSIENEIRHEFLYGAFCNLEGGYGSLDGYRKFLEMRRKIRADRIRMKQEQEMMQKKFWDDTFNRLVGCFTWQLSFFRYAK
jgi:hypothetical protein